jgi:hypothetical protein
MENINLPLELTTLGSKGHALEQWLKPGLLGGCENVAVLTHETSATSATRTV